MHVRMADLTRKERTARDATDLPSRPESDGRDDPAERVADDLERIAVAGRGGG